MCNDGYVIKKKYDQKDDDPTRIRTLDLEIWSLTQYHYAMEPCDVRTSR